MPMTLRCWSSGTARPEAAGSSSRHIRCRDRAAAPCTWQRSATGWERARARAGSRFPAPARSPTGHAAKLTHLVSAFKQALDLGGVRQRGLLLNGQGMQSVPPEVIEWPRHLIHQRVRRQDADHEDDAEKVDPPPNGGLDLQGDVALVHADMHVAGLASDDTCRHFREVSEACELAVVDILSILVVEGDLVGHARHERMCHNHALLVRHEYVRDAGDLYEL